MFNFWGSLQIGLPLLLDFSNGLIEQAEHP